MPSKAIQAAAQTLLAPAGIEISDLEQALGAITNPAVDLADLFFEYTVAESWSLEDSIVKQGSHAIQQGIGVRAVSGEKTGFAYTDELAVPAMLEASQAARAITTQGQNRDVRIVSETVSPSLYTSNNPLAGIGTETKIELLKSLDTRIRDADPRVEQVMLSLTGRHSAILVAGSDGILGGDQRPLVRLNVSVIVNADGRRESASFGGGGRTEYDCFLSDHSAESIADEALRQALVNLDARSAPAGETIVVLGPGWPGILLHEAIGHGLEGDFNRKKTSAFTDRVGEIVASKQCTVVDDATLPQRRGSLAVDDEGTPGQNTTLIENGKLRGYLHDKHNAHLMGLTSTGNGRRQSYAHRPMPRMTNTYMIPGNYPAAEIIESVSQGIYAVSFGGGQVDITNGKFVFSASEAYLIENGRVTSPVKGATLIGDGPDVLQRVSMVGDDLALDNGVGMCGKNGQQVPVGVGQPTIRIDGLTVGGTDV